MLGEPDAAAWWRLRLEALENEPLAFGKSVEEHMQTAVETITERFKQMGADYFTLGAFEGDALIGMVTYVRNTGATDRHKGNVYGVYVSPSHQGQGIGKQLLTTLIERANADASVEQLVLAVATQQETAKTLYRLPVL